MLFALLLLVAGVIHLVPLVGVRSAQRLEALYGVDVATPELSLLLRHRAVLFGLVGAALCGAIVLPALRWPAMGGGLVSMVAFLGLCVHEGVGRTGKLRKVVVADVVSIGCTLGAAGLLWAGHAPSGWLGE